MTITNNSCHCSTISIVLIPSIPVLIHISISTTKSLSSAFLLCTDEIIGKFFINFSCTYYNHLSTVEFDITTFFRQRYMTHYSASHQEFPIDIKSSVRCNLCEFVVGLLVDFYLQKTMRDFAHLTKVIIDRFSKTSTISIF